MNMSLKEYLLWLYTISITIGYFYSMFKFYKILKHENKRRIDRLSHW